ncbi:MAG: malate synthase A, partial [Chloroflexi bacterium]|nr:malate synthase A [Chloroflexota bacterium]
MAASRPSAAPPGIDVVGPAVDGTELILTPEALAFVGLLQRRFGEPRRHLLERRRGRQAEIDAGAPLQLLPETASIRADPSWRVAEPPPDLLDRRVEITGPAEPKMMINALNSGARVFMADFEDALSPTWANVVGGQAACFEAVRGTLAFDSPEGKSYRLGEHVATLLVRPRGWHLPEAHVRVDGEPMSASLFDFGLYAFHNIQERIERGTGLYLYLPKLQSHLEARLWNEVFDWVEAELGVPRGTIRATVLIETIHAAFEMEEILFELRDHSSGLNAGRWDYLFSCIKTFRGERAQVLPDRGQVTMTVPFMRAYTERLVLTCHRRGA